MAEGFCEYTVKKKTEGASLALKIALVSLYVAIAAVPIVLALLFASAEAFLPILIIAPSVSALTAFITWRFTSLEFEFVIDTYEMTVSRIYGKRIRKRILCVALSAFTEIGEYNDAAYAHLETLSIQKNDVCVSSLSAPVMLYGLYRVGEDTAVIYFEADERAISLLKKNNSGAFRAAQSAIKEKPAQE